MKTMTMKKIITKVFSKIPIHKDNQMTNHKSAAGKCNHFGPEHVFTINNTNIIAGDKGEIYNRPGLRAIISLMPSPGSRTSPFKLVHDTENSVFPSGLTNWSETPQLMIDWPDMGTPPLPKDWWEELMSFFKDFSGDIGIHCQGGHGRTGTFLTILAGLGGVVPKGEDPVDYIRRIYCEKAVETDLQLDYIEGILDTPISASPSNFYRSATTYVHSGTTHNVYQGGNTNPTAPKNNSGGKKNFTVIEDADEEERKWIEQKYGEHLLI